MRTGCTASSELSRPADAVASERGLYPTRLPRAGAGRLRGAAGAVCLALAVAAGAGPARAGEPGQEAASVETKLVEAFRAECAAKAAAALEARSMTVAGRDGWLFLAGELRHLGAGKFWGDRAAEVSRAARPEWADPMPAILDFKRQMDAAGIQLILVPVPPKAVVYPDMITDAVRSDPKAERPVPRLDIDLQAFYALLREKGVDVLDLADALIASRKDEKEGLHPYCMTDTHWSPTACQMTAGLIVQRIGKRDWLPRSRRSPFATRVQTLEIAGDLAKGISGPPPAREKIEARIVTASGRGGVAETVDKASPVLVLGDSHCLVFNAGGDMHAVDAGLADQLAADLGMPIDCLGVRGSGATPARLSLMRRARADAGYLPGKKVIVWCFTAREFTESQGWREVPVVREAAQ